MKQVVVNKEDLRHNINKIKAYTKQTSGDNYTIIGIVKGNGYGLGLKQYARFLVDNGINFLAVATLEEAIELASEKICNNILLLSALNTEEELEEAVKNNVIVTIDSRENSKILNELAQKGYNIRAHIKIDTGFGRYGFMYDNYDEIINSIEDLDKNIKVEGIFSHFSIAYYKDNKHTKQQFDRFNEVINKLEEKGIQIQLKHICNSPAFLNYPEMHLNAARIGSAFVGRVHSENNIGLKRIGEYQVSIAEIRNIPKGFYISYLKAYKTRRDTKIAVLPIGYIDGYNVSAKMDMFRLIDKIRTIVRNVKSLFKKQNLTVIIKGKRYDVIGTIRNVSYNNRCNRWRG